MPTATSAVAAARRRRRLSETPGVRRINITSWDCNLILITLFSISFSAWIIGKNITYHYQLIENVKELRRIAVENYYYHCVFKVEATELIRQRNVNDPEYKELFDSEEFKTFTIDRCLKDAGLPNNFQVVVTTDILFNAVIGIRKTCERTMEIVDEHLKLLGATFDDEKEEEEEEHSKPTAWTLKMEN